MGLFKENPFGHILFIKKWLIRILAVMTHQRYKRFNKLEIEGSDVIRNLQTSNVLFVSNHQTYFADVVAMEDLGRICQMADDGAALRKAQVCSQMLFRVYV